MAANLLYRRLSSGTGDTQAGTRQRRTFAVALAWLFFFSLATASFSRAQTTTTGNLQWWPLKANNQDSAAVRAPGVVPATTSLRNFYLSDVTLGTAIRPYSAQFGEAFGSSPSGDGSFIPLPGSNLNRVYYAQFTITAAANATLRADSVVLWSAFNNTASNLKLAVVYSKTGFTTNDSTEVAGGTGPIGPLTTRTTTPGTGTGTFADPIFLRNQNTGPNQTYRLALNRTGGVQLAAGQTLTIRLYYASGSSSAGRYALLRDFRVVGQASTTSSCNASFTYPASSFCANGTNPTPTVSGTGGGTFSSTAGLSLNASTGAINLAASTPGTYTVTYSTGSTCSSTASVTVTAAPTATFSYPSAAYCSGDGTTPTPTVAAGATSGTFSSTAGLAINAATGALNLVASTPGTYTVTNTVAASGNCAAVTATTSVTISPATTATFAYSASTFCQSAANPTPSITGTSGGTFSSTAGLSINATTGAINLAASTPGTYTVTYRVGGNCPSSGTQQVTITSAPLATFSYANAAYCVSGAANPAPVFATGASAGTFSATPVGLSLNASTGAITLAASTPGTYTVTNTVAGSGSCAASSASTQVTIQATPTATLTAGGPTTFCQGGSVVLTAPAGTGNTYQFLLNGNPISGATAATYTASASGSYSVVVTNGGGCTATSAATTVTVNPATTATFAYSASTFCQSAANPTPTVTGNNGGTFSSTAGLSINASTGAINLTASTPGTYTVTYSVGGTCPSSATASVTITNAQSASFSYAAATYCTTVSSVQSVVLGTGSTAGTFSSTAGLTLNATTGAITPSTSTPGTYTVTNTVAASGGCSAVAATATVTITAPATAGFSYAAGTYCADSGSATSTLASGASAGTFSSTSGLSINASTGAVNLTASTPGTYTVTNTVAASGGCSAVAATATLTIVPLPARPTFTVQYNGAVTTLTSSAATGNQWYLNGVAIPGATGQTYVINSAAQYGSYTVVVSAGGCSSAPSAALVVNSSVKPLAGSSLSVFPNPTHQNTVTVELSGYRMATELSLYNSLGQLVYSTTAQGSTGTRQVTLELTNQPAGVYVLRAKTEGGLDIRRIVKE
ncbi:T9SS type A sorting domain-containing protein [Hymenobacter aquaticus]|uniref:T9SS type A sorting domain-containing protein n=1 Tax=Hymenobacter aquaticus TaxID=1867101 RepID=A0A4Z0Q8E2_9BACT|nr:T9SS type A sorting domain-containing protein [Hymenobacter aquaticus]TGE25944.1 T9SS type A sorting domain-containing protein [Hymenobacter aquaticus]